VKGNALDDFPLVVVAALVAVGVVAVEVAATAELLGGGLGVVADELELLCE
jgi:hypothetical protein